MIIVKIIISKYPNILVLIKIMIPIHFANAITNKALTKNKNGGGVV